MEAAKAQERVEEGAAAEALASLPQLGMSMVSGTGVVPASECPVHSKEGKPHSCRFSRSK